MAKVNVSKELADKIINIREEKTVKESDVKEIKDLIDRGANVNTYSNEYVYFASPKSSKLQRKIPTPTWGNLASGG